MARRDRASPAPAAGLRQGLRRGRRLHRRRRRRRYGSDQGRDRREHHHYAAAQEYRGLLGRRPCLQRPVLRRDAARRGALVRGHERPGCRDQGRGGRGGDQAPVHGLLFPCHVLRRRLRVLPKLRRLHICREHLLLRGDIYDRGVRIPRSNDRRRQDIHNRLRVARHRSHLSLHRHHRRVRHEQGGRKGRKGRGEYLGDRRRRGGPHGCGTEGGDKADCWRPGAVRGCDRARGGRLLPA
mmetsp:Transcript_73599/g.209593  ORF Transcript_73599/g.209593 Transcript_73599/m.209593 type:complete len:239 (-) Transcript_73599:918-1634(-)